MALACLFHIHDGDAVVIGVGDEQHLILAVKRERVGRGALRGAGGGADVDSLDGLALFGVDDGNGVLIAIRNIEAAGGIEFQVIGVGAGGDGAEDLARSGIDHGDRRAAPVADVEDGAIGAHLQVIGADVDGDLLHDLSGGCVEDADVAARGIGSPISRIEQVLFRMHRHAHPVGLGGRQCVGPFGGGLFGEAAVGVVEDIDWRDGRLARAAGIASGNVEFLAVI